MKTVTLLALATTGTGCYCGSYGGGGDLFYKRGNDTLTMCGDIGGFVMNRDGAVMEGVFALPSPESTIPVFDDGATGARAFTLVTAADGSVVAPELGDAPWQPIVYDDAERDHADIPCRDLTNRPWWGTPAMRVPVDTAFVIPNPSVQPDRPCSRGGPTPSCSIELDLCTGGGLVLVRDGAASTGGFTLNLGVVSGSWFDPDGNLTPFSGMYTADGVLSTVGFYGGQTQTRWTRLPPDPTKPVAGCR